MAELNPVVLNLSAVTDYDAPVFGAFVYEPEEALTAFDGYLDSTSYTLKRAPLVKTFAPQNITSVNALPIGNYFWHDLIHIVPNEVDFGEYMPDESEETYLYNASHSSVVVSIGTYDEVVEIAGTTFPVTIEPITGVVLTITLDDSQSRDVNETIRFSKTGSLTDLNVLGLISSIVFPFIPEAPMRLRYEFLTDINVSRTLIEQRTALRPSPLFHVEQTVITDNQESEVMENLLFRNHNKQWSVPCFFNQSVLDEDVAADSTELVGRFSHLILSVGDNIIIYKDHLTYEVGGVSVFTDELITLNRPLLNAWDKGDLVTILVTAFSVDTVRRGTLVAPDHLDSWIMQFTANTPLLPEALDDSVYETINDEVILDYRLRYNSRELNKVLSKQVRAFNSTRSFIDLAVVSDDGMRSEYIITYRARTEDEVVALLQLGLYFKGRIQQFYLSSMQHDFNVISSSADLLSLRVEPTLYSYGLPDTVKQRNVIEVEFTDGTIAHRNIESVTEGDVFDTITVDSAFHQAASNTNVSRVSYLKLVRPNIDSMNIEILDLTEATLTTPVIEIAK